MQKVTLTALLKALLDNNVLTEKDINRIKTVDNLAKVLVKHGIVKESELVDKKVLQVLDEVARKLCSGASPEALIAEYKEFFKIGDTDDTERNKELSTAKHT